MHGGADRVKQRAAVIRALLALGAVVGVIAAINLSPLVDRGTMRYVFDMNDESNLVVWLSSTLLLAIGAAAAVCAMVAPTRRRRLGWVAIATLFGFLSLDETASLHEQVGRLANRRLDIEWLPGAFVWVLVLGPIAVIVAVAMLLWMRGAFGPRTTALRLAASAVVVWVLVLVPEALAPTLGSPKPLFVLEETLEFAGEILTLGAIALHLIARGFSIRTTASP